ncbi:MAG TPA: Ig-like domain-containing protein, partial [Geobacteraceae bacterium]
GAHNASVILIPASNLAPNTTYTATLTTGIRSATGTQLPATVTWSFNTGTGPIGIGTPLTVTGTVPANATTAVPVTTTASATFNIQLEAASLTSASFSLSGPGGSPVAGAVSLNTAGTTATFTPATQLASNTTYTARLTTSIRSTTGIALQNPVTWQFSTGTSGDTAPPTVLRVSPAAGATGVPLNSGITVIFTEAMNQPSVSAAMSLTTSAQQITGAVGFSFDGTTATFRPSTSLAANTSYTLTVFASARDLAGNNLPADFSWNFQTGSVPDTTAPTVIATTPVAGASNVSLRTPNITATFTKPIDPASVDPATVSVTSGPTGPSAAPIGGFVSVNGSTVSFVPVGPLQANINHTVTLTTGIKDQLGNPLATAFSWNFTTGSF